MRRRFSSPFLMSVVTSVFLFDQVAMARVVTSSRKIVSQPVVQKAPLVVKASRGSGAALRTSVAVPTQNPSASSGATLQLRQSSVSVNRAQASRGAASARLPKVYNAAQALVNPTGSVSTPVVGPSPILTGNQTTASVSGVNPVVYPNGIAPGSAANSLIYPNGMPVNRGEIPPSSSSSGMSGMLLPMLAFAAAIPLLMKSGIFGGGGSSSGGDCNKSDDEFFGNGSDSGMDAPADNSDAADNSNAGDSADVAANDQANPPPPSVETRAATEAGGTDATPAGGETAQTPPTPSNVDQAAAPAPEPAKPDPAQAPPAQQSARMQDGVKTCISGLSDYNRKATFRKYMSTLLHDRPLVEGGEYKWELGGAAPFNMKVENGKLQFYAHTHSRWIPIDEICTNGPKIRMKTSYYGNDILIDIVQENDGAYYSTATLNGKVEGEEKVKVGSLKTRGVPTQVASADANRRQPTGQQ